MALGDLTTYEVWFDDGGNTDEPVLLYTFQDEIGLSDADVKIAAVAKLQAQIDKIETPGSETISIRVGVVYPPAVSVRKLRRQNKIDPLTE